MMAGDLEDLGLRFSGRNLVNSLRKPDKSVKGFAKLEERGDRFASEGDLLDVEAEIFEAVVKLGFAACFTRKYLPGEQSDGGHRPKEKSQKDSCPVHV